MKEVSHTYNLCFGVSFLATHVLQLVNNILLAPCVIKYISCQVRLVRPGAAGPGAVAGGRMRLHGRRGRRHSQGAALGTERRSRVSCYQYNILLYFFFCEYFLDSLIT